MRPSANLTGYFSVYLLLFVAIYDLWMSQAFLPTPFWRGAATAPADPAALATAPVLVLQPPVGHRAMARIPSPSPQIARYC